MQKLHTMRKLLADGCFTVNFSDVGVSRRRRRYSISSLVSYEFALSIGMACVVVYDSNSLYHDVW